MAEFELGESGRREAADPPEVPEHRPTGTDVPSVVQAYSLELNHYYGRIKEFETSDPEDVLRELSGISARLTEMRANCQRLAGQSRGSVADRIRTKEIDPLLEECDRQFKLHSRLQAIREFDLRMAGGAPS